VGLISATNHSSDTLTVDAIDLAQARRNHRYRDHSHTAAAEVRKVYPRGKCPQLAEQGK
jgi:hypothetical protein